VGILYQYRSKQQPARGQRPAAYARRAIKERSYTLISDQYNHRVVEVNRAKRIVRTFGKINSPGYNAQNVADEELNSPYDAKRIGDYTGLTPPSPKIPATVDKMVESHGEKSAQKILRRLCTHRICEPSEFRQLTAQGLSPCQICSLVGLFPLRHRTK